MSHDDFDDGLVHGHDWASEQAAPAAKQRRERRVLRMAVAEDFDDGLIHGHAWAMGTPE